jgi:hypothetical protein
MMVLVLKSLFVGFLWPVPVFPPPPEWLAFVEASEPSAIYVDLTGPFIMGGGLSFDPGSSWATNPAPGWAWTERENEMQPVSASVARPNLTTRQPIHARGDR